VAGLKVELATQTERYLKGSDWLTDVLRRADLVALDNEANAEGQGKAADRPYSVPSMWLRNDLSLPMGGKT
jgi:ParB family chromosome partitioning protein